MAKKIFLNNSTNKGYHLPIRRAFIPGKAVLVLFFLLLVKFSFAQEQNLQYAINRNGKKVGNLIFQQVKAEGRTVYNIHSQVKVSMVLSIDVKAREQSVYENDIMQSSSLVRHVNGKQKANQQIKKSGNGLLVTEDGTQRELKNYSVKFNIHSLYTTEPLYYSSVFSDSYHKFIPIIKMASHHYKLTFPDGNSNEYFYENGICKKVKVRSQLFDAEFVLTSL